MSASSRGSAGTARLDAERLLAEDAWMRALARSLVRGPESADDLVQDAWVAALSRPASARAPRAWLGGVLRNLLSDRRRAEARRAGRERAGARPEAQPAADDALGDVEHELVVRRDLAEGLVRLPEPLRSAVVLRFLRRRTLTEVARVQGVAPSTAHERVERGLARLRAHLDAAHGDRGAWLRALAPLAAPPAASAGSGSTSPPTSPSTSPSTSSGAGGGAAATAATGTLVPQGALVAMSAKTVTVLVASLALVAGGTYVWSGSGRDARPRLAAATPAPGHELAADPVAPPRGVADGPTRAERRILPASADAATPPASAGVARRGVVVDAGGAPVPGLALRLERGGDTLEATTDSSGAFAFRLEAPDGNALDPTGGELGVADERWTLLLHLAPRADDPSGERLVVTPTCRVAGVVLDHDGAPVAGARLAVVVTQELFRTQAVLRSWEIETPRWEARADAAGRFAFERAVGGPAGSLVVTSPGFVDVEVALPPGGRSDLVVTLGREREALPVTGVVLAPDGTPARGALVSLGADIVETGADGRFELAWEPERRTDEFRRSNGVWVPGPLLETHVTAIHREHGPVRVALDRALVAAPLVLRLTPRAASLRGRVVGPDGAPLEGAVVWFLDPTPLGFHVRMEGEGEARFDVVAEEEMGRDPAWVSTGGDGRFLLEGLFPRPYRVQACDPRTGDVGPGWTLEPGPREVELVLAAEPDSARVAGRVVSPDGVPLAGVEIRLSRALGGRDEPGGSLPAFLPSVATDAEGRFAFERLALAGTSLRLDDFPRILLHFVPLADAARPLDALELVVPRLCELQVDATGLGERAASIVVLDERGDPVRILDSQGAFLIDGNVAAVVDGRTSVLLVEETGRTVSLRDGADEELLRRPLELAPERRAEVAF